MNLKMTLKMKKKMNFKKTLIILNLTLVLKKIKKKKLKINLKKKMRIKKIKSILLFKHLIQNNLLHQNKMIVIKKNLNKKIG